MLLVSSTLIVSCRTDAVISDELDHELALNDDDLKFTWYVDWQNEDVILELNGLFKHKYKWFALGFSHRGDPGRTDYCIFYSSPEQGGATVIMKLFDHKCISSRICPSIIVLVDVQLFSHSIVQPTCTHNHRTLTAVRMAKLLSKIVSSKIGVY